MIAHLNEIKTHTVIVKSIYLISALFLYGALGSVGYVIIYIRCIIIS